MEQTKKKNKAGKIILIIVACILGVVLLFVLGVRAYFRIPVAEYYKNSNRAFVIPGLNDGMTHQGLAYNDGEFFITGYRSDGEASQVSIVSAESGKEVKRVSLLDKNGEKFLGHVGGITVWENYVYVADSDGLVVYSLGDFKAAEDGGTVTAKGIFSTKTESDKLGVAFTHAENGSVYVGEFYREANYPTPDSHKVKTAAGDSNPALILEYKLDSTAEFGISDKVTAAYSIPGLVQGMCFDNSGRFCLSTSYATAFSHVYIYNEPARQGDISVFGQIVPLYVLDSSNLKTDVKLAPMSEEIVNVDGKMYTMCESATNKYIFGKFTSAKYCYATDLSKYDK